MFDDDVQMIVYRRNSDESQDEFKDSGSSTEIDVLSGYDGNEKEK